MSFLFLDSDTCSVSAYCTGHFDCSYQRLRYLISPVLGASCRFYPSCSQYALAALEQHGIGKALFLTLKRLLRCQPWARGGVDFVPK